MKTEISDIFTEVISTPGTQTNPRVCIVIDGGVCCYIEALGQVFQPRSEKRTTPQYPKFNHATTSWQILELRKTRY